MRCISLVLLSLPLSACRLENPAFEDTDELADASDRPVDDEAGDESLDEGGSGSGSSGTSEVESEGSNEAESSSESEASSSESESSGSSSESESESSGSSSEEESSSSSGEDGPEPLMCQVVVDPVDCYSCAQKHCCDNETLICFDPEDPSKCGCVLECLGANNLLTCLGECKPGPVVSTLVSTMVTLCTSMNCGQYCND
ncbi:MAG: hypothetical protein HC927_10580 [Deltaproteobacteria bacterium]|nr:hypothetical protein [Deltaproteobacteria bacterium]